MKPGKDFIGVGVGAFILNDKNELLMLLRAKNSSVEPGTWMIPGGKIDFNEKMEDTVKREAEEEIGVQIEVIDLVKPLDHILPDQHWITSIFLCRIKSGDPRIMEPHKHDKMKWFPLDKMPENLSIATKNSLKAYQEKYQK